MRIAQLSATKGVGDRIAQERRLKAARDERDVDQRDLAQTLGVTPGAVSRWENGLTVPKDDVIEKLARYFGVTPGWLRYGQEPRAYPAKASSAAPIIDPHLRPATEADAIALEEKIHGKRPAKKASGGGRSSRRDSR